jgi:hypothetical protein
VGVGLFQTDRHDEAVSYLPQLCERAYKLRYTGAALLNLTGQVSSEVPDEEQNCVSCRLGVGRQTDQLQLVRKSTVSKPGQRGGYGPKTGRNPTEGESSKLDRLAQPVSKYHSSFTRDSYVTQLISITVR